MGILTVLPWVIAAVALIAALVVAAYFVRLIWVLRFATSFICSVRIDGSKWKRGFARFQNTELLWYSLYSARMRPKYRWQRAKIQLQSGAQPVLIGQEHWESVPVVYPDGDFELFMPQASHSAMVAWVEALPPQTIHFVTDAI